MENINKIKDLMGDKDFVAAIAAMEDPEDVQSSFADKGVDFTLEQINQIAEMVIGGNEDELSEAALEGVSGGLLAEIAIVASGVALFANTMAEVNKARKAAGKKTIW